MYQDDADYVQAHATRLPSTNSKQVIVSDVYRWNLGGADAAGDFFGQESLWDLLTAAGELSPAMAADSIISSAVVGKAGGRYYRSCLRLHSKTRRVRDRGREQKLRIEDIENNGTRQLC